MVQTDMKTYMQTQIDELKEKAKALARQRAWLGVLLAVTALAFGGFLSVKGTPEQSQATFAIGGEILTAVFEDNQVTVVSSTAPVSVTTVSGTDVVTSTLVSTTSAY